MRLFWSPWRRVLPHRPRLHVGPLYPHGVRLPGGFYLSTQRRRLRRRR